MSIRDSEWRDWPAKQTVGLTDEEVMEGVWWAAMAYAVGLLIFRLMQIFGIEIGI